MRGDASSRQGSLRAAIASLLVMRCALGQAELDFSDLDEDGKVVFPFGFYLREYERVLGVQGRKSPEVDAELVRPVVFGSRAVLALVNDEPFQLFLYSDRR